MQQIRHFESDLLQASKTFGPQSKFQEFVKLTKYLTTVYSVELELTKALDIIKIYKKLAVDIPLNAPNLVSIDEFSQVLSALFSQALMLYCRATDASAKIKRKPVLIVDQFSDGLKRRHLKMKEIRDKAFAHYEESEESLQWNVQSLYAEIEPHQISIKHSSKTKFFDNNVTYELYSLCLEALKVADDIRHKTEIALHREMQRQQNDPDFFREINKNGRPLGSFQLRGPDGNVRDVEAAKRQYLEENN